MSNSKIKKINQLGMNPSTAQHALKKQVLFGLVKKCGLDICYQCEGRIESSKELSLEHKIPWLDSEDPIGLFFDLENIAFSHLSCNSSAARKSRKGNVPVCGSASKYRKGCRCDSCRTAQRDKMRKYRSG